MRALVFEQFGEPAQVLTVQDVPVPLAAPGEVVVRMLASPINPSDLMTVRGTYGVKPQLPATPGYEGVGVVESAAAGLLGRFFMGKRVAVLNARGGNWQERVVVPARSVIPLSPKLSIEQAAMFFVNPATAYLMTRKVLRVPRGKWLLQTAAGSAVGRMVIRLGRQYGFRTMNIVRRKEQIDELVKLGADEVLVFDPARMSPEDLARQVHDCLGSEEIHYAIDPVGGVTGSAAIHCLGTRAHMLLYGTLAAEPLQFSSRLLMTNTSRIEGFWLGRYMAQLGLPAKLRLVSEISRGIQAGLLDSAIAESFDMAQVASAVQAAELPGKAGKVLLRFT